MAEYDGSIRIGTKIDTKGFEEDGKELESKSRKLAETLSGSSEVEVKIDSSGAKKEFEKVFDEIEKEEKRIAELAERAIDRARSQQEEISAPDIQMEERTFQPGYNQEAIKYMEDQTQKIQKADEHWNQLRIDVEEYAKSLKELQDQGKFFGNEDYDKVYLAWKNATDAIKAYRAELNKQTESGQAKIAEQEAKAAERREAAQRKAEEQAERALQRENERIQKQAENEAKLQAKEAERQEKVRAEAAEEQRLDQIRVNAVASNDQIIAKVERIKQLEQEIADLKAVGRTEGYSDYDDRIRELSELKQGVKEYRDSLSTVPEKFSIMRASAQEAFNNIRSGFSAAGNMGKKAFSGILRMAKKTFFAITSGSKKSNKSMSGGLKTILKYAFGIRSLYVLFNKFRNAVKEGFGNLAQFSEPVNESLSALKSSLTQLKNSLATAFAPIITTVAPALKSLIDMLSRAATYVGMFIATLTGAKTFTKAIAVQEDYAKSLNGTASAAKKAAGALAKFDDLDVLQKPDASSGGAGGVSVGDMFEEVEIPNQFENIADLLKQMWDEFDFKELGEYIANGLKNALDSIPWNSIKESSRNIAKSIATLINGFIQTEGIGYSIGNTLVQGINAGFEFLNSFVHNLHWESIGKFIAETINGFFANIDWNLIYDTFITGAKGIGDVINSFADYLDWEAISNSISNFFNSFVDTIYSFITTVDWKKVGEKVGKAISDAWNNIDWSKAGETVGEAFKAFFDFISSTIENIDWWAVGESVKDFLVGIDWAGVAESFFEAVGAAIGGFAAFIGGLIADGVEEAKQYFQDKIEEAGGNVVEGIFVGIAEALVNIGEWIKEHVFKPFIDGFKKAFGIHSPSTVMEEMGGYIIEGLLNGLKNMWNDVVSWITDSANWLIDKVKRLFDTVSGTALSGMMKFNSSVGNSAAIGGVAALPRSNYSASIASALNNVPALASGSVIRGGNPFMAILGDQPAGKMNVEAPADLIKEMARQGMREELAGMNFGNAGSGQIMVVLRLNGVDVGEAMIDDLFSVMKRRGYDVDVLGVT